MLFTHGGKRLLPFRPERRNRLFAFLLRRGERLGPLFPRRRHRRLKRRRPRQQFRRFNLDDPLLLDNLLDRHFLYDLDRHLHAHLPLDDLLNRDFLDDLDRHLHNLLDDLDLRLGLHRFSGGRRLGSRRGFGRWRGGGNRRGFWSRRGRRVFKRGRHLDDLGPRRKTSALEKRLGGMTVERAARRAIADINGPPHIKERNLHRRLPRFAVIGNLLSGLNTPHLRPFQKPVPRLRPERVILRSQIPLFRHGDSLL